MHDSYVKKGLMETHKSGMRCSIHSFLPHNAVVIAINKQGEVIGTVSIIKDNPIGLPAELIYEPEINLIRSKPGRELIEISALSISPDFRQHSHAILFLLNKFLYLFSRDYFQSNTLVITTHPDAAIFYKSLFNFKVIGKVCSYKYVKDAPATLMYMDFSGNHEENMWKNVFNGRKDSLIDYILYQEDSRIKFPATDEVNVDLRDKEAMLKIIKASCFDLHSLNLIELSYLYSSLNFNQNGLAYLGLEEFGIVSDYRFQKKINAYINFDNVAGCVKIHNISTSGAYVEISKELLSISSRGVIKFKWKNKEFVDRFKICWINNDITFKLSIGAGGEFLTNQIQFF